MPRRGFWLLPALWSATLDAAVVRGVVVDNYTGRPLARALVTLKAVAGYGSVEVGARAASTGVFTFPPVNAGAYLLTASRPGFATLQYGQKAWNAPGAPVFLEQEAAIFLQLRLRHLGAITGSVWDENEVGFPDQDVVAYRATRPPKMAGKVKTDDRGVYRIGLLEPGRYFIRTMARQIDSETGVLPTFFKEVAAVEDAVPIQVSLEDQTPDINVRPIFGKVFRLSGTVIPPPTRVRLISDMGDIPGTVEPSGNYHFENLAPGNYEILAEGTYYRMPVAGYWNITLDRDRKLDLGLQRLPSVQLQCEEQEGRKLDPNSIQVFLRRKTLAGEEAPQRVTDARPDVPPGRYEIAIAAPPDLYPVSITGMGRDVTPGGRADGWHEITLPMSSNVRLRITLSAKPAVVHGRVTGSGNDPVIGAPVYLEAFDPDARKRLVELRSTRTGARGEYHFASLPPGTYRLLSTFDFEDPDEETMEASRPKAAVLKEATDTAQDLELYVKQ